MTHLDADRRPDAESVLRHPWVRGDISINQPSSVALAFKTALLVVWLRKLQKTEQPKRKVQKFTVVNKRSIVARNPGGASQVGSPLLKDLTLMCERTSKNLEQHQSTATPGSSESFIEDHKNSQQVVNKFELESKPKRALLFQQDRDSGLKSIERRLPESGDSAHSGAVSPFCGDQTSAFLQLLEKAKNKQQQWRRPVMVSHQTDIHPFLSTAYKLHDQEHKLLKASMAHEAAPVAGQHLTFYRCEERKPSRRSNPIVRTSLPLLRSRKHA